MSTRAFIALSLLAACSLAFAGSSGSPKGGGASRDVVTAAKEKAMGLYDVNGNGMSASLPQYTFTTVADASVGCGKKSCSILMEAMAELNTGGADWAICMVVDGVDYQCQYQGLQSGPSGFVSGNARGFAANLGSGAHDVQMQLYTESATATYQYFQLDATALKP
jgi:hypothetical protein